MLPAVAACAVAASAAAAPASAALAAASSTASAAAACASAAFFAPFAAFAASAITTVVDAIAAGAAAAGGYVRQQLKELLDFDGRPFADGLGVRALVYHPIYKDILCAAFSSPPCNPDAPRNGAKIIYFCIFLCA